jgi:ribosome-interacting GTPase 1
VLLLGEITSLVAKTADLIIIMLDATKSLEQKQLLEIELDAVGIRLNKHKPDVVFKQRPMGGVTVCSLPCPQRQNKAYGAIQINATVPLTHIDEKGIKTVLAGCEFTYELEICIQCWTSYRQDPQLRRHDQGGCQLANGLNFVFF